MSEITCPFCGSEFDIALGLASAADHEAFDELVRVGLPAGAHVARYLTLFKPRKQRLTLEKKQKLLKQLLPDLHAQRIKHKGQEWPAPLAAWSDAIDRMQQAFLANTLEVPLTSHGYLYAVIAGLAEKSAAAAEAEREHDRRLGPRRGHTSGFAGVAEAAQAEQPAPRPIRTTPQTSSGSPAVRQMKEEIARKKGLQQ